ncbi:MAG: hypothetical protein LBQ06_05525, partial [Frankiaceae bacterium]|nr:hypothetical protein [Frankiaceae bacterium]
MSRTLWQRLASMKRRATWRYRRSRWGRWGATWVVGAVVVFALVMVGAALWVNAAHAGRAPARPAKPPSTVA